MCLCEDLFGFILFGTLCAYQTWMSVLASRLCDFFFLVIISSDKFSVSLSLLLLGPYNVNISMLDVVPEVS